MRNNREGETNNLNKRLTLSFNSYSKLKSMVTNSSHQGNDNDDTRNIIINQLKQRHNQHQSLPKNMFATIHSSRYSGNKNSNNNNNTNDNYSSSAPATHNVPHNTAGGERSGDSSFGLSRSKNSSLSNSHKKLSFLLRKRGILRNNSSNGSFLTASNLSVHGELMPPGGGGCNECTKNATFPIIDKKSNTTTIASSTASSATIAAATRFYNRSISMPTHNATSSSANLLPSTSAATIQTSNNNKVATNPYVLSGTTTDTSSGGTTTTTHQRTPSLIKQLLLEKTEAVIMHNQADEETPKRPSLTETKPNSRSSSRSFPSSSTAATTTTTTTASTGTAGCSSDYSSANNSLNDISSSSRVSSTKISSALEELLQEKEEEGETTEEEEEGKQQPPAETKSQKEQKQEVQMQNELNRSRSSSSGTDDDNDVNVDNIGPELLIEQSTIYAEAVAEAAVNVVATEIRNEEEKIISRMASFNVDENNEVSALVNTNAAASANVTATTATTDIIDKNIQKEVLAVVQTYKTTEEEHGNSTMMEKKETSDDGTFTEGDNDDDKNSLIMKQYINLCNDEIREIEILFGKNHPKISEPLSRLGLIYQHLQQDYDNALKYHKNCLMLLLNCVTKEPYYSTYDIYRDIGICLVDMGQIHETISFTTDKYTEENENNNIDVSSSSSRGSDSSNNKDNHYCLALELYWEAIRIFKSISLNDTHTSYYSAISSIDKLCRCSAKRKLVGHTACECLLRLKQKKKKDKTLPPPPLPPKNDRQRIDKEQNQQGEGGVDKEDIIHERLQHQYNDLKCYSDIVKIPSFLQQAQHDGEDEHRH